MTVEQRLEKIMAMLFVLNERQQVREWYSVEEFARIVGRSDSPAVNGVYGLGVSTPRRKTVAVEALTHRGLYPTPNCYGSRKKGSSR